MKKKAEPEKFYRAGFPNGNGYPYGYDDMPGPGRDALRWSKFRAELVRSILNNDPWECGWRVAIHDDSYIPWHRVPKPEAVLEGALF